MRPRLIEQYTRWKCTVCREVFDTEAAALAHEQRIAARQDLPAQREVLRALVGRTFALHMAARYPDRDPPPMTGRVPATIMDVIETGYDDFNAHVNAVVFDRVVPRFAHDCERGASVYFDHVVPVVGGLDGTVDGDRFLLDGASKDCTYLEREIRAWEDANVPEVAALADDPPKATP